MLAYEKTKEENAVEIYFCEPLSQKKTKNMNDEISDFFILFSTSNESNVDVDKARKMVWQYAALEKRIDLTMNYTADNRVKLFIVMLCDSSIGKVLMYAYYMQYLCKKNNVKHINWEKFGNLFPDGFFTEEDLNKAWEGQKVSRKGDDGKINTGSDNLLEYGVASKSLIF